MDSKIIADEAERQRMKTFACLYCILAPYDNEQQDMMLKLDKSKQLDDSPLCKELLRLFMCKELIDFGAMESVYGKELLSFEIFDQTNAHGKKCWTELKNRVIEHVSFFHIRPHYYLPTAYANQPNYFSFFFLVCFRIFVSFRITTPASI